MQDYEPEVKAGVAPSTLAVAIPLPSSFFLLPSSFFLLVYAIAEVVESPQVPNA